MVSVFMYAQSPLVGQRLCGTVERAQDGVDMTALQRGW